MSDEIPVTPEQQIPEAVSLNKLRLHSSKVYPKDSVDLLISRVSADSEARFNTLSQNITNNKTETDSAISQVQSEFDLKITEVKSELEEKIGTGGGSSTGTSYQGTVELEADLESIASNGNVNHGDWYIAKDTGDAWVWTVKDGVGSWERMSGTVNLEDYVKKDAVYSKAYIAAVVNRLVAAENKLSKITSALSTLESTEALKYETYSTDELFHRYNTLLSVLKAAVATSTPSE